MLTIRNIVCLFCLCKFVLTAQYVGDYCTFQDTGATGQCTLLNNCPEALDALQRLQKFPQTCGFQGTQPIVCCTQTASTKTSTTTPRSTTTTRTTERTSTTTRRKTTTTENNGESSIRGPRIPGVISETKCKEYGKYIYAKKKPPILLIGVEEAEKNECGFKVVELIVGGEIAKRKEFPHMALIGYEQKQSQGDIVWGCGGSIISEQFILTAGHCLISRQYGDSKYVKIGMVSLSDPKNVQQFNIIERIKHPNFKPPSHYNDIGLLKLDRKANLNPYARPACLYTSPKLSTQKAIASGWGKTMYGGDTSDDLLKVTLQFITEQQCNNSYSPQIGRKLLNGIMYDTQVCAGSPDPDKDKDTCQGDSGGPLQIFHPATDVKCMYDIVGITSFGKACGIGISPGVYTRVSSYIQWIEDIVWP